LRHRYLLLSYIRLNGKLVIKSSYERDILPENIGLEVIPQIITNDPDEFLFVAKYVQELGYKELNWNLGCPYPMVTKCGMGSGLISNTEKINTILSTCRVRYYSVDENAFGV
jgi:tRNA-dihydrouridine synthase